MALNPAHWHLMVNHIPLLWPVVIVLLMVIGLVRRSRELLRLTLALTLVFPVATYLVTIDRREGGALCRGAAMV